MHHQYTRGMHSCWRGGEVGGRERMRGELEKGKEGGSHTNTPGHVKGPNKPCSLIINIFFLVFYVYNLDA